MTRTKSMFTRSQKNAYDRTGTGTPGSRTNTEPLDAVERNLVKIFNNVKVPYVVATSMAEDMTKCHNLLANSTPSGTELHIDLLVMFIAFVTGRFNQASYDRMMLSAMVYELTSVPESDAFITATYDLTEKAQAKHRGVFAVLSTQIFPDIEAEMLGALGAH